MKNCAWKQESSAHNTPWFLFLFRGLLIIMLILCQCFIALQKVGPKMLDSEGKEVPGNRGYKYFGAAKDLPGVRELFETDGEGLLDKE